MNRQALSPLRSSAGPLMNYAINPQVNEKQFDEFTALVASLCNMPKALITLIDGEKLWFKSNLGMPVNYVAFKKSYCQFTLLNGVFTEFPDTKCDPSLIGHEWTMEYPEIGYYAGVPLVTEDGCIGTLCVMDSEPRVMTAKEKEILTALGRMVSSLLESRKDLMGIQNKKTAPSQTVSLRSMRSITRSW